MSLSEPDLRHSSILGGSGEEDKDVNELGKDENKEPYLEELQRCLEGGQNAKGGSATHISGVLPPEASKTDPPQNRRVPGVRLTQAY